MPIQDISHPIMCGMPVFTGDVPVKLERLQDQGDGIVMYRLQSGLHAGTHVDLPMHLGLDDREAWQYPPEAFIARGALLNAARLSEVNWRQEWDTIAQPGDAVMVYTGWDTHFLQPDYYVKYPIYTREFAESLIRRQVKLLVIDGPAPDHWPFDIHRLLLAAQILIVENATGLGALLGMHEMEFYAVALPLRAEASLVRAFVRYDTKLRL